MPKAERGIDKKDDLRMPLLKDMLKVLPCLVLGRKDKCSEDENKISNSHF